MCGIVGTLAFKNSGFKIAESYIARMRDTMIHRGPDEAGTWVAGMSILIGFQLVSFYIFTKIFAITEGFLPQNSTIDRCTTIFSLELGISLGTIFLILGPFFLGSAILVWQQVSFGELSQTVKLKQAIPAIEPTHKSFITNKNSAIEHFALDLFCKIL